MPVWSPVMLSTWRVPSQKASGSNVSVNPHDNSWLSPFYRCGTEAQRGSVSCPRSHSGLISLSRPCDQKPHRNNFRGGIVYFGFRDVSPSWGEVFVCVCVGRRTKKFTSWEPGNRERKEQNKIFPRAPRKLLPPARFHLLKFPEPRKSSIQSMSCGDIFYSSHNT
jgi:hypothetical protein